VNNRKMLGLWTLHMQRATVNKPDAGLLLLLKTLLSLF
jgi:hypothetical protein